MPNMRFRFLSGSKSGELTSSNAGLCICYNAPGLHLFMNFSFELFSAWIYFLFFYRIGRTVRIPWSEVLGIRRNDPVVTKSPKTKDGCEIGKPSNVDDRRIDFYKSERYLLSLPNVGTSARSEDITERPPTVAPESCTNRLDVFYAIRKASSEWAVARLIFVHTSSSFIQEFWDHLQQTLSGKCNVSVKET